MKLLMMGPQGCGKGTIGEMLSDFLKIPIISPGQLLRELPKDHPRYNEIREINEKGELAPQDFVAEILKSRVSQPDCANGYILDGWGRKMVDLTYFDPGFDKVILLKITPETSIRRLSGRRTCKSCGEVFNINSVPPKVTGICDECGGELYQREDDTEEAIRRRLEIYYTETQQVAEYFRNKGILLEIDAEPTPDVVFDKVLSSLNLK